MKSPIFEHGVMTTVKTAFNSTATSIVLDDATSPNNNPPTPPSGGIAYLTLTDSSAAADKVEIISYTGVTTGTGQITLTGVSRGLEGTTAQSWAVGDVVNQGIPKTVANALIGPAFEAERATTDQTLSDATEATLIYNSETKDSDGCYNTSNGRFTPNKAGFYLITAGAYFKGTGISQSYLALVKNGTAYKTYARVGDGGSVAAHGVQTSRVIYMNGTTDYIEVKGYANVSGGSPTLEKAGESFFSGSFLRG